MFEELLSEDAKKDLEKITKFLLQSKKIYVSEGEIIESCDLKDRENPMYAFQLLDYLSIHHKIVYGGSQYPGHYALKVRRGDIKP